MSEKRTFDDVRNVSPKLRGDCVVCGDPYEANAFRGRIQLVLYKHKPSVATKSFGDSQQKQVQKSVASESRIMCESCSVEMFERMAAELPERQHRRADKEAR